MFLMLMLLRWFLSRFEMNPSYEQFSYYSPMYPNSHSAHSSPCFGYTPSFSDAPSPALSNSQTKRKRSKDKSSAQRQRKAANERERRRMYSINKGFDKLRDRLPNHIPIDKKLSKVDTLKTAIEYIHKLHAMIVDAPATFQSNSLASENPTITISNQNDPFTKFTISWHRRHSDYGTSYRDNETGAVKATCSKVWIPGM
ncbi:hypothetical protein L596_024318 [Steinernema carpocapsae]|uniref:BHLH domain-containing protein n=1 Tax=Steinernema carpocapsae TaxID=34508 RepID=A0A4U5MGN5_STECR|nr:hypothetical protein L596_024318 [Steinernema carpocapsae]